jgi:uncharacterized membrane protein
MKDRQPFSLADTQPGAAAVRVLTGRARGGWLLALGLTLVLLGMASLPPFVGPTVRGALMHAFSAVCHQIPERSPHLHGVPLAVCHRCYGIYGGFLLGVLGYLVLRRREAFLLRQARYVLVLALLPAGLDWLLGLTGVWVNTPWSRALTGAVFGFAAGLYLASGFSRAFTMETAP